MSDNPPVLRLACCYCETPFHIRAALSEAPNPVLVVKSVDCPYCKGWCTVSLRADQVETVEVLRDTDGGKAGGDRNFPPDAFLDITLPTVPGEPPEPEDD